MNENMKNLEKVLEGIRLDAEKKLDFEVPFNQLRMRDDGAIYSLSKGERKAAHLSEFATTQLFTKADMPARYMKRLMNENSFMVAEQFNLWAQKQKDDKNLLIRGKFDENKNLNIRGVLSERYAIMDNEHVLEHLTNIVKDVPDFEVISGYTNDRIMHVRLAFPDMYKDFGISPEGKNDIVRVGVDIVNSEIGYSSLEVTPMTYRLVCTNGMRAWRTEVGGLKQRHVHISPDEFAANLRGSFEKSLELGKELLEGMGELKKIKVFNVRDEIDKIVLKYNLRKSMGNKMFEAFQVEPERNMFGVLNSLTRVARDITSREERLILETVAGDLLNVA